MSSKRVKTVLAASSGDKVGQSVGGIVAEGKGVCVGGSVDELAIVGIGVHGAVEVCEIELVGTAVTVFCNTTACSLTIVSIVGASAIL